MIKILIDSYDSEYELSLIQYINEYFNYIDMECFIRLFNLSKQKKYELLDKEKYDIVFIDTDKKQINITEFSRNIRKKFQNIFIVIITTECSYAFDGYRADVIRCLYKDDNNFVKLLNECLYTILHKMNFSMKKNNFTFVECNLSISTDKIIYIESKLHKAEFHIVGANKGTYSMYKKLDEIEEEIKNYFFIRIHQSYLVNIKFVLSVSNYSLELTTGEVLPIPKVRFIAIREVIYKYQSNFPYLLY